MKKGNVLVVGNSGVGKSTLINAVLGEDCAVTGYGDFGSTEHIAIHENDDIPFRLIDTVGFTPEGFWKNKGVKVVQKWTKEMNKNEDDDSGEIHLIWFCIDGTSHRLFDETIKNLQRATSIWETVPFIVVITKSYALPERVHNVNMVENVFANQKEGSKKPKAIIPVVAERYVIRDDVAAETDGIAELIETTGELLPEGMIAAEKDLVQFRLKSRDLQALRVIAQAAVKAALLGDFSNKHRTLGKMVGNGQTDILKLADIYKVQRDKNFNDFLYAVLKLVGQETIINKIKSKVIKRIPARFSGRLVDGLISIVIAVTVLTAVSSAFRNIYLGKKTTDDLDALVQDIDKNLDVVAPEKILAVVKQLPAKAKRQELAAAVMKVMRKDK